MWFKEEIHCKNKEEDKGYCMEAITSFLTTFGWTRKWWECLSGIFWLIVDEMEQCCVGIHYGVSECYGQLIGKNQLRNYHVGIEWY